MMSDRHLDKLEFIIWEHIHLEEDIKENSRLSNRKEENKNNDSGIANKSFLMLDENINLDKVPSKSPKIMIVNAVKSNGGNDNEI